MSRNHAAFALGDAAEAEERTMQEPVRRSQVHHRRSGVELIGIVGKDWVVLNGDRLAEPSVAREVVGNGIRWVCRFLALD